VRLAVAGFLVLGATAAARAGKCTEISTVWTLFSSYVNNASSSRIYDDGLGSYVDGSQGVTARIRSCSTNDAVLMTGDRHVTFNFADGFLGAGNVAAPDWTNGPAFASTPSTLRGGCHGSPCTVLNVGNVLAGGTAPRNQYYVLFTRGGASFVAPDNINYRLWMRNPHAGTTDEADAFVNSPYDNARVVVEHYPANYMGQASKEYWLAYPETLNEHSPSPQNGTLLTMEYPPANNYGQFSMPFYFRIDVK